MALNTCKKCGGKLLIEEFGQFGDIYRMKRNGDASKRRIKRKIYGDTGEAIVYCEACGKPAEYYSEDGDDE